MRPDRAVTPVIGTVLLIAVVVVIAAASVVTFSGLVEEAKDTNEKPIPVSENLLANSGFESGTDEWNLFDTATVGPAAPSDGSNALEVPGEAYAAQSVTEDVRPGYNFRLCAQSKLTVPSGEAYVGVQFYDNPDPYAPGATIVKKETWEIEWSSYRETCVYTEFENTTAIQSAEVWVFRASGANTGTAYVDEVSFRRVRYLADPDEEHRE